MTKTKQKAERNKGTYLLIMGALVGLIGGMMIGMLLQQMILTAAVVEVGESLEGTTFNVEVEINETQIMNEYRDILTDIIAPGLNQNKTIG